MAKLNEKNENTQKIIHLVITEMCKRNCPMCCNKQYDMNAVEYVTIDELKNAETIFLTGGEPFLLGPYACSLAAMLRNVYKNIKNIYVYTNAYELAVYLERKGRLFAIDGVTISIKQTYDYEVFEEELQYNPEILKLKSNWLYTFPGFSDIKYPKEHFIKKDRVWQEDFVPDPNSIFRRWR